MEQRIKKQRHWHKGKRLFNKVYTGCVGMACNLEAHNGDTLIERCECGSHRFINNNRGVNEYGTWLINKH